MDKSIKMYKKALTCYQLGKIDKAVELCEKSISTSMKNSAAINLKGLLCYLKGDLEAAKAMWRMNVEINKDAISKKYLQDCKNDEIKDTLFIAASKAVKGLNIREAIELLLKCANSDYNCINVYNLLAECYIKTGEYDKAVQCIEKVLDVDKSNKVAKEFQKSLIGVGIIKSNSKYRFMLSCGAACFILLILCCTIFLGINKFKVSAAKGVSEVLAVNSRVKKQNNSGKEKSDKVQENKKTAENTNQEVFPYEDLNKFINDKNFQQLYSCSVKWKNKNLSINEKSLLAKADDLLKKEGINYFYNIGLNSFNKKDYLSAVAYFYDAADIGEENELYPHIIYTLAVSLENTGDIEKAIQYYEEYINKYPKGIYKEEALYRLAQIYKPLDINKSKNYAQKIAQDYPNSMYNNSNIKDILNTQ